MENTSDDHGENLDKQTIIGLFHWLLTARFISSYRFWIHAKRHLRAFGAGSV